MVAMVLKIEMLGETPTAYSILLTFDMEDYT